MATIKRVKKFLKPKETCLGLIQAYFLQSRTKNLELSTNVAWQSNLTQLLCSRLSRRSLLFLQKQEVM